MKKKIIYLDNASTTPVQKEVILAMKPYWSEKFGNPSSITKIGVEAKKVLEKARMTVAECLLRRPNEIVFTSGGTESNNLAIFGVVNDLDKKGQKITDLHFITTNIEHSSITECFKELERRGAKVDYLKVNEKGLVEPKDLRKLIKPNTVLVSIGYANNEIGTIQPIREIAKEIRHAKKSLPETSPKKSSERLGTPLSGEEFLGEVSNLPYFHTDASQAGLYLDLNVNQLGVDLMTLDAQKINGPKGVGVLFVKAGTNISPIIFGGGQEKGLRSGTENIPLIVGLAKALELRGQGRSLSVKKIRDYFWQKVQKEIPSAILNGDQEFRLPNNLNFSIPGINPEFVVLCLDEEGIICSTKSACDHDEDESFVVRALVKSDEIVKSALRFSLSEEITKKDIDYVLHILKKVL
jgi:cysteine desulfurase